MACFPFGTTVSPGCKIGLLAAGTLIGLLGVKLIFGFILGIPFGPTGTVIYYATTFLLFAVLLGWSNVLQRKLPERMTEELTRQG